MPPSLLARLRARALELLRRARDERSTPRELAWSLGVGVFLGCTPFVGLHMWLALGAATVLRLNRLWAFLGSRISFSVIFVWITFAEIELGQRLLHGAWLPVRPAEALAHGRQLLGDWFFGAALVGTALGAVAGALAYVAARRWALSPRTPGGPPPRTSESPPSAPPAPTS